MTELHSPSATAALPDTPEGCRARLATLHSEIAAIRVQIATADLRRHLGLLDFLTRAAASHSQWLPQGEARQHHHRHALDAWY